jgi:hypothetical protein
MHGDGVNKECVAGYKENEKEERTRGSKVCIYTVDSKFQGQELGRWTWPSLGLIKGSFPVGKGRNLSFIL